MHLWLGLPLAITDDRFQRKHVCVATGRTFTMLYKALF